MQTCTKLAVCLCRFVPVQLRSSHLFQSRSAIMVPPFCHLPADPGSLPLSGPQSTWGAGFYSWHSCASSWRHLSEYSDPIP